MARKRRSFSGAFKAKVALAACRGDKTTAQLAGEYGVHVGQITTWKKQLLEGAARLFEDGRSKRAIDEQYLRTPFYGSRKLAMVLGVNRKRIQRLMRVMGIEAIYPKRRTTWPGAGHKIYPYLLRNVAVMRPDQVWASDITYVPLR